MTSIQTTRLFGMDFRPLSDEDRECFAGAGPAALISGGDQPTNAPIFIYDPASGELSIIDMDNDEPIERGFKQIR